MAILASAFGTTANLRADKTFPLGLTLSQFADDSDAISFSDMEIGDAQMGINGDLIVYQKPATINVKFSVMPGSDDDKDLTQLFYANTVGRGKRIVLDIITMSITYSNNSIVLLTGGIITSGSPGYSPQSSGRLQTKSYAFKFETARIVQ